MPVSPGRDIRLSEPNFYVRVHPNLSEDFLREALRVVRMGFGMPAFVNDQIIVPSLEKRGVAHADALNYSTMGCVEVLVPASGLPRQRQKQAQHAQGLELTLKRRGATLKAALQLKPGRGDITQLRTFDDLTAAWREQLLYYTQVHVTADNINDHALKKWRPTLFARCW